MLEHENTKKKAKGDILLLGRPATIGGVVLIPDLGNPNCSQREGETRSRKPHWLHLPDRAGVGGLFIRSNDHPTTPSPHGQPTTSRSCLLL